MVRKGARMRAARRLSGDRWWINYLTGSTGAATRHGSGWAWGRGLGS